MISIIYFMIGLVAIATVTLGCSEPIGGYDDPTEAEKVNYADLVIVAKVVKKITPDPVFKDAFPDSTYGALVQVRCTYKGGILGDSITIHGAGFIPGMCTAKPLDVGKTLILFLRKLEANTTSYEQMYPGEDYSQNIEKYRDVCDLKMRYPQENGMTLPRETCERPFKQTNCKRFTPNNNDNSVMPVKPKSTDSGAQPDSVVVKFSNQNDTTTSKPDNSTAGLSVSMALLALCSILRQFI